MWLPVTLLVAACLVTAARGRSRLLDGDDNLGSPGELAWQAWLLMDGASASAEAGGARRITPKSVFIAPAFAPQSLTPCADGHKRDAAGRCVQVVHINRDAQLSFLLQRLNALHARPAPGRLPSRIQEAGPLKVPLRVSLPTGGPALSANSPAEKASPAPSTPVTDLTEEPPSVSVVTDVAKRSSAEDGLEPARPVITVWTIENNTLHKTEGVDGWDSSFTVEIPTTTESANGAEDTAAGVAAKDVLAPSEVEGALPMLVISPGTADPATPTTPMPDAAADEATAAEAAANRRAQVEGSGEPSKSGAATERADEDSAMKESEDEGRETGSADVMEHIEVVPISEHSRHNLPIMGEDRDQETNFSQTDHAAGIAEMFRPLPLEIMPDSEQRDGTTYGHPVRFPDEDDEPQTVHLFKGNYIKFPQVQAYRYKHRPATEKLPDMKQTSWWNPSGWRIDQSPVVQHVWPRMSLNENPSFLSQYNPSQPFPLPYRQRQAQYDPQWSSMRKQMTSL